MEKIFLFPLAKYAINLKKNQKIFTQSWEIAIWRKQDSLGAFLLAFQKKWEESTRIKIFQSLYIWG